MKTQELCRAAVFMALVFIVTRFIQIPIPLGYFNVGNTVILSGCVFLSPLAGILAAGIGSALADLTSYPVYTIPTLIIKTVFPLIFYVLMKYSFIKNKYGRYLFAALVSTLIPLFGYTIVGGILYGGFAQGLAQFPGLLLEYIANGVLAAILYPALQSVNKSLGISAHQ